MFTNDTGQTIPRMLSGLLVLILLVGAIWWLVGSGKQSLPIKSGLNVVAAENFWGNIASQIGGPNVHVSSIITDPTADPHLYESSAQNAVTIASARVVIVNGLGYDDFMGKLLSPSKNNNRQVLTVAQMLHVTGTEANPHLWYDLPSLNQVATSIAASYEAADPAHKSNYQHNLQLFQQSLKPLLNTVSRIKQQYAGSPVVYTEPVPAYLLKTAGLDVKTPASFAKAIEDGNDPSAADTTTMDNLITGKQVRLLFYNVQATSPITQHIRNLAIQSGVPVVSISETMPASEPSYQSWQQDQLNAILNGLGAR